MSPRLFVTITGIRIDMMRDILNGRTVVNMLMYWDQVLILFDNGETLKIIVERGSDELAVAELGNHELYQLGVISKEDYRKQCQSENAVIEEKAHDERLLQAWLDYYKYKDIGLTKPSKFPKKVEEFVIGIDWGVRESNYIDVIVDGVTYRIERPER